MLTKQDLNQIKKVVRDEVVSEAKNTRRDLRSEIKLSRMEIQNDIHDLTGRVKNLEQQSEKTAKDIKKIKKDAAFTANFLDKEHLGLEKRVNRIETHLDIRPLADF